MKILVCQIYFKKIEEDEERIININLRNFFQRICNLEKSERTSCSNPNSPILVDIKKIMPNNKLGLSFYKYREGVNPYIENNQGDLTQLEDTLVELTNAYLDDSNNLLYLQYNYNGLKAKKIEEYLNEFIVDTSIKLHLEPLYKDFALNLIYNSDRIKDIYLKMRNDIFSYEDTNIGAFSSIVNFINNSEEETRDILELKITAGRGKRFDGRVVEELVNSTEDSDTIEDILIEYKDNNGEYHKESIKKLREELYFVIFSGEETRNLGWEYIIDNIYANYSNIENEATRIIRSILINMEAFNNELDIRNINN